MHINNGPLPKAIQRGRTDPAEEQRCSISVSGRHLAAGAFPVGRQDTAQPGKGDMQGQGDHFAGFDVDRD
jgi:hypothetical protein